MKKILVITLIYCFCCTCSVFSKVQENCYRHFTGNINENEELIMDLLFNDTLVSGYYYNTITGIPVLLSGRTDQTGFISMKANHENHIFFTGKIQSGLLTGTLKRSVKEEARSIKLSENYKDGSLSCKLLYRDSCYIFSHHPENKQAKIEQSILVPSNNDRTSEIIGDLISGMINNGSSIEPQQWLASQERRFLDDYKESCSDFNNVMNWFRKSGMHIAYNRGHILSLRYSIEEYTGGAHGNMHTQFIVIETSNGKVLNLNDIISEASMELVTELITRKIKVQHKIDPAVSLQENGFYSEAFEPSENFYLTEKGICFYYNTYEIAPYFIGPTSVFISYDELSIENKVFGLTTIN